MIKIVDGDLLKATENIIAHQVNAKSTMGSGVALSIRNKYPIVYNEYMQFSKEFLPHELMGECHVVEVGENKCVANLFGQLDFGRDKNIVYTNYDSLSSALILLREFGELRGLSVALPYGVGCGLANGSWDTVLKIIDFAFAGYEVTLYRLT